MRRLLILASAQLLALACAFGVPWVIAQTTPIICEVFVDCTGSGNKVSGQDWNNMRAYSTQHVETTTIHVPQRSSANCAAETGGVSGEICLETGNNVIYACPTGPCNGAGWQIFGNVGIPGVTTLPGSPSAGDVVIVLDDSAIGACDSNAGSQLTLCRYSGTAWQPVGMTAVVGWANSAANAFCVGDGTDQICSYCESGVCYQTGPSGNPIVVKANISLHTTTPITLNASTCTNHDHISSNTTARTFNLCDPAGGETVCVSDDAGSVVTIDPNGSDVIVLNGTPKAAGEAIVSGGTRGDYCCMIAKDASTWLTKGCQGFT